MAIGLGLMMGFMFAKNFDAPYRSSSITEFWQRWHQSLSSWLRDYLYIPLGGNRRGGGRTYINLMLVMLLGGLWHGASWNFVIWGGIHGTVLMLERLMGRRTIYHRLPLLLRRVVTFVIVLFSWVFFRAADLPSAIHYCSAMLGFGEATSAAPLISGQLYSLFNIGTVITAAVITWFGIQTWDFTKKLTWPKAILILMLFAIALLMLTATSFHPFIYFIF